MKQCVKKKKKTVKWGFKFWYRCASTTGYLYQLELYLGKKDEVELNLGESVVLKIYKVLEKSHYTVYFDNFFNGPLLILKLFKKDIYGVETAQSNRRGMPALPSDKKMKRGDSEYQFSTDVGFSKWMDNWSVVVLFSNIEGMQTKSRVYQQSFLDFLIIIFYNKGMGRVDLVDQRTAAYHPDRKPSIRFYLRIFFDLMDVAYINSYIAFSMLHTDDLTLLNFKIAVATHMIGPYTSRKKAALDNNIGSKRAC